MKLLPLSYPVIWVWAVVCLTGARAIYAADQPPVTRQEFQQLQEENRQLEDRLQKEDSLIESLTRQVSDLQKSKTQESLVVSTNSETSTGSSGFHLGKVDISGEGGLAFFESQSKGQTPNSEFRIDEARLFVEAPIWDQVYFYTELNLATREENDLALRFGELYLDFEGVSRLWNSERTLNIRAGRFYIPFGEEYLQRFAIDNPLISHSLGDLWGEDNGVELYGQLGAWGYNLAVQNGGVNASRDFNGDKSVSGKIGWDPLDWLHLSVSAMRTGDLDSRRDMLSAMWFGGGFFRSMGSSNTTVFHANLAEFDLQIHEGPMRLSAAGGYINYDSDDPNRGNNRDVYYFYAEERQQLTRKLYSAARFSEVFAHNGFPIVGNGDMGTYLFNELTSQYWRLSLGLGYNFSRNLLLKGEYSFNRGREVDGTPRNHQDLFALEAAYKF